MEAIERATPITTHGHPEQLICAIAPKMAWAAIENERDRIKVESAFQPADSRELIGGTFAAISRLLPAKSHRFVLLGPVPARQNSTGKSANSVG